MACSIPYIRTQQLSETEKARLESIHIEIFKKAKESKAFREVGNRLQAVKSKYADATSFIGRINQEYDQPVSRLSPIGNGNAVLSVNVLPLANELQEVLFQRSEMQNSVASAETLEKVKSAIDKMGIKIQDLASYAKEAKLETTSINGLADLSQKVIAISQGMENVALTEEMVHIATSMIEQTNPKLVTEMISKIDRFKIYKETLNAYKD